jgi:hypothetical protein
MLFAGLTLIALCAILLISYMGVDAQMWRGISAGAAAGLALMSLGWFTTLKGLKAKDTTSAMGHMLGGFFLRLVILVSGLLALALTGWGDPAGFAIAFMMTVLVYLAMQILLALKDYSAAALDVESA